MGVKPKSSLQVAGQAAESAASQTSHKLQSKRPLSPIFPIILAVSGFLFFLWVFQPGFMTPDPIQQLQQARSGAFNDWHPPIMSWIWKLTDSVEPGPIGMLAFHLFFFWGALWLWSTNLFRKSSHQALFMLVFAFLPPVLSLLGMVWKDVGMGIALLLATGLIVKARAKATIQNSKKALLWSLVPLFYGLNVRLNAIIAGIPLFYLWADTFILIYRKPKLKLWPSTAALATFFLGLNYLSNALLIDNHVYPLQQVLNWDLAALSDRTGEVHAPPFVRERDPAFNLESLRAIFNPNDAYTLVMDPKWFVRNEMEMSQVFSTWKMTVLRHPWEYLEFRSHVFKNMLFPPQKYRETFDFRYVRDERAGTPVVSPAQSFIQYRWFYAIATRFLPDLFYSFVLYLLIPLLAWFIPWVQKPWSQKNKIPLELTCLSWSSTLYFGFYFFIGTAPNFRYVWWCVLVSLLCLAMGLSKQLAKKNHE